MTEEDVGQLRVEGGMVRYHSRTLGSWAVAVRDVRVVGEYTNQDGPFLEDWFLVLVTGRAKGLEAPTGALRFDALMDSLRKELGPVQWPTLSWSTDFASNVLWPAALAGRALRDFAPERQPGILGWVRWALAGSRVRQTFTPEVLEFLEAPRRSGGPGTTVAGSGDE